MKFALTFITLSLLLLLGCHKQSDAKVRNNLAGTWLFEKDFSNGNKYESAIIVSSNRDYVCNITMHGDSNSLWTYKLEGSWQIKNGFLIDTTTKHSDTNAKLP